MLVNESLSVDPVRKLMKQALNKTFFFPESFPKQKQGHRSAIASAEITGPFYEGFNLVPTRFWSHDQTYN